MNGERTGGAEVGGGHGEGFCDVGMVRVLFFELGGAVLTYLPVFILTERKLIQLERSLN